MELEARTEELPLSSDQVFLKMAFVLSLLVPAQRAVALSHAALEIPRVLME